MTGAGSGIGRCLSIMLSKQGVKVTVADLNLETAEETVKMIEANGGRALAV